MSSSYVIEVGDHQVGIVLRNEGESQYRFHAALDDFQALDGRTFSTPRLAESAAVAHAASRRARTGSDRHRSGWR
jgi:hypothetical protein